MPKEDLLKIFDHFGTKVQQKKLNEEVFEFQEAIFMDDGTLKSLKHITEEMADVLVLLSQFKADFEISDKDLDEMIKNKVQRTLGRIEEGYYD